MTAVRKNIDAQTGLPNFSPIRIQEVEISRPLPTVSAWDSATGKRYQRALSLVRLHQLPLGLVELSLTENDLTAAEYARRIWQVLASRIDAHLRSDGLPQIDQLGPAGIPVEATPRCRQKRETLLSGAPFVSVVVATRDRPDSLADCLESLRSLDYADFEIIVVDSAPSSSATADLIRQQYGDIPQVRYLTESVPGLAVAHNRGLTAVRAPIVAFTDDDVIVDPLWLAQLVQGFDVAEDVGCVTGMILPQELETPAQVWIEQSGNLNKGFRRRIFDLEANRPDDPLYPYAAGVFGTGANMAFRTSVLREIGGFDPALGAGSKGFGGDDLAAFFDVIASGYTLVYEPSAMIRHQHRRDYAGLRRLTYGYGVGLTAYLMKTLVDQPSRLFDFTVRIPKGLIYAMNPQSPKNINKSKDYPRELTRMERRGMLYGPFAYLASRWQSRKIRGGRLGRLDKFPDLLASPCYCA